MLYQAFLRRGTPGKLQLVLCFRGFLTLPGELLRRAGGARKSCDCRVLDFADGGMLLTDV